MAVKLMGVAGEKLLPGQQSEQTQDFLLLDNQTFFIKNALEFAEFDAALLHSEVLVVWKVVGPRVFCETSPRRFDFASNRK